MCGLDTVAPDQRAVVQLIVGQHRTYGEVARLAGVSAASVRARAHAGLAAMAGPEQLNGPLADDVADFLLGQQAVAEREATQRLLAASPDARAWARAVAVELGVGAELPEIPGEAWRSAAGEALDLLAADPAAVRRSRHRQNGRPVPVQASGLSLRGQRGWVYRDVTFAAAQGGLIAIEGPPGSGRTSLLLTLAGRMRPSSGTARVDRLEIPRQMGALQRVAALGLVAGVNDLERALTVSEHFREAELLRFRLRPFHGLSAALETLLGVGVGTRVGDLDALQRHLLGTAMALIGPPRAIFVDGVDVAMSPDEQSVLWEVLEMASRHVTVIATTMTTAAASRPPDLVVRVGERPTLRVAR
jgi:ABC-2 type transport system ATP-binding protein